MKNILIKAGLIFSVFFMATYCLEQLDSICLETTGYGGKLLFNVEKLRIFN